MVTAGSAAKAAAVLRDKLSNRWWLQHIALGHGSEGYVVRVGVARVANDVSSAVPPEVLGVPVELFATK